MEYSESQIQTKVVQYARKLGWKAIKQSSPNNRGLLDYMFLHNNRTQLFIEFKRKGKKPTTLQENWLEKLTNMGFPAFVIDDVEEGKFVIEEYTPRGFLCKMK